MKKILTVLFTLGLLATIVLLYFLQLWISFWALSIIVGLLIIFIIIYYGLAPANRFFTFVKEGTSKVIVKGNQFHKALITWEGHTFDDEWNIIPEGVWTKDGKVLRVGKLNNKGKLIEEEEGHLYKEVKEYTRTDKVKTTIRYEQVAISKATQPRWEPSHLFGGLRLYSLLHPLYDIYIYGFRWVGISYDGELQYHPPKDSEEDKEWLDFILVKDDVYSVDVPKAEDQGNVRADLRLTLTIRIVNPRKALFDIQDWLETILNRIRPAARDAYTQKYYDDWISNTKSLGDDITYIIEERGFFEEEFIGRYGVDVRKLEVAEIELSDPKYQEIVLAPRTAEYEKKATITQAEAEKEKKEIVAKGEKARLEIEAQGQKAKLQTEAEGEADRISIVYGAIKKYKKLGEQVRILEAMEKGPNQGGKWVLSLPEELISKALGGPKESLSPTEMKELKKLLLKSPKA